MIHTKVLLLCSMIALQTIPAFALEDDRFHFPQRVSACQRTSIREKTQNWSDAERRNSKNNEKLSLYKLHDAKNCMMQRAPGMGL